LLFKASSSKLALACVQHYTKSRQHRQRSAVVEVHKYDLQLMRNRSAGCVHRGIETNCG